MVNELKKEKALSASDSAVLEQLFDPESAPTPSPIVIDPSLPAVPHVTSHESLASLKSLEVLAIRAAESGDAVKALSLLSQAIAQEPKYASAYNNRAQVYRMQAVLSASDAIAVRDNIFLSSSILNAHKDLSKAIDLAAPATPTAAISAQQAKLLANAHTQRATLLHTTSKYLQTAKDNGNLQRVLKMLPAEFRGWDDVGMWEEAASRDFFWGGRYGNEVAKAMAVHTNPYAKLCGSIVKEAMKKEMGEGLRQAGVY